MNRIITTGKVASGGRGIWHNTFLQALLVVLIVSSFAFLFSFDGPHTFIGYSMSVIVTFTLCAVHRYFIDILYCSTAWRVAR